ncbi:MAG: hypothetical protein M1829_006159 [Trizodia sp. TS-e1964]|nr:MAG: hypothetical protein M1829_006159 [Trizodia sp. TS-e1964]
MANLKKTYFLVPDWDIPVSSISIGSVIADPFSPHKPLGPGLSQSKQPAAADSSTPGKTTTPAPDQKSPTKRNNSPISRPSKQLKKSTQDPDPDLGKSPENGEDKIVTNETKNVCFDLSKSGSIQLSIWAEFLSIFGLGGDTRIGFNRENINTYAFKKMTTSWFLPSLLYVENAVKTQRVQNFLKIAGQKPLYIITGIKSVEGAKITTSSNRGRLYSGKMGVDVTSLGAPVTLGPQGEVETKTGEAVSWECESPIVFAYQLTRIKLQKGAWKQQDFTKGAVFGTDKSNGADEAVVDEVSTQLLEELDDVEVKEVWDDDGADACTLVVPLVREW